MNGSDSERRAKVDLSTGAAAAGETTVETILIIEDDQRVQKALRRLFEPEGYTVQERGDGRLGVEAAREFSPAAIVLDLRLPGMPGHDVCREIKAAMPEIPVIILSATTD